LEAISVLYVASLAATTCNGDHAKFRGEGEMMQPKKVDDFMMWVSTWATEAHPPLFAYLAVVRNDEWVLIKGMLYLNLVSKIASVPDEAVIGDVRAGFYTIDGGKDGLLDFCGQLVEGKFTIGDHGVIMVGPGGTLQDIVVDAPTQSTGTDQTRNVVSTLLGAMHGQNLGAQFSWLLRAGDPPFDSMEDLASAYSLGPITDVSTIDVVALIAAFVDARSVVSDTQANIAVKVLNGFDPTAVRVGYRTFSAKGVSKRGCLASDQFDWSEEQDGQIGRASFEVNQAAVVQAYATYSGRTQQQWWFQDPKGTFNPRRVVYETHDPGLTKLKEWLHPEERRKGRSTDYEIGISVLGWLLGCSSLHLDRTRGLSDGPDVLLTSPEGLVLVECTTGSFGTDKLAELIDRRRIARQRLLASGHFGTPVQCIIASTVAESEATVERQAAIQHGVVFIGRESVDKLVERTVQVPNTAQLFRELLGAIKAERNV